MDWIQWGSGWLRERRSDWIPQPIYYIHKSVSPEITISIADATVGFGDRSSDQLGIGIHAQRVEWILRVGQLLAQDGKRFLPAAGDEIVWRLENIQPYPKYDVCQAEEGVVWKWHDRYQQEIRVFTELISLPNNLKVTD